MNSAVGWMDFDMLRLANDLELHRFRTRAYPPTLASLVQSGQLQKVPLDPLSGKPYIYSSTAGRYELSAPAITADWNFDKPLSFPIQ
jgi:hypothetical protein